MVRLFSTVVMAMLLLLGVTATGRAGESMQQMAPQQMAPDNTGRGVSRGLEVCGADGQASLPGALAHHAALISMLARTKGLPRNPVLDTNPGAFERYVADYLRPVAGSALILYAADDRHFCAFMWRSGQPLVYARRASDDRLVSQSGKQLSAGIVSGIVRSDAQAGQRVEELRALGDVFAAAADAIRSGTDPASEIEREQKTMSELLFPREFREGLAATRHLTIIPIGAIASLPLAYLTPLGTTETVIDRFSVNMLLFATEVQPEVRPWSAKFTAPLVVGNPKCQDVFCRIRPLAAAEAEAKFVAAHFGAAPVLGEAATTISFIARAPDADLIYVAAHAVAGGGESQDPLRDSFILFSDARLVANQIKHIPLKARLVVLSACQTGLGRVTAGGVIGVGRLFLDAGAANVVTSLWNIDDNATRDLMVTFVELLDDHVPAEALRRAQLKLREKYPQPVYWAAFNVFGNHFAMPQ